MVEQKTAEAVCKYNMIRPGSRIVVGISGGADSVCLLQALLELTENWNPAVRIRAVHVHHGLRNTADHDAAFVQKFCGSRSIPLEIVKVDAAGEAARRKQTVEETGRELRYQAFVKVCRNWDEKETMHLPAQDREAGEYPGREETCSVPALIAVAHHLEDSAETVLFNLCRGSSLAGLAGIRPVSDYCGIRVIRPLITCTREEIEAFLSGRNIPWCIDETNENEEITRNYIRRRILPEMTGHVNHAAVSHIARAARDISEAETFLREETQKAQRTVQMDDGCMIGYSVSKISELPDLLQKRVLYQALTEAAGHRKDIGEAHVDAILKLMNAGGSGLLDLPYGIRARKEYDRLYFVRNNDVPGSSYPESISSYSVKRLPFSGCMADIPTDPYTKWVDYDKIKKSLQFRTRQPGDVIVLDAGGHSKKLSRVMIDLHIPAGARDQIILPMSGNHAVWFPGYRIGADCRVEPVTEFVLEIKWINPERKS